MPINFNCAHAPPPPPGQQWGIRQFGNIKQISHKKQMVFFSISLLNYKKKAVAHFAAHVRKTVHVVFAVALTAYTI